MPADERETHGLSEVFWHSSAPQSKDYCCRSMPMPVQAVSTTCPPLADLKREHLPCRCGFAPGGRRQVEAAASRLRTFPKDGPARHWMMVHRFTQVRACGLGEMPIGNLNTVSGNQLAVAYPLADDACGRGLGGSSRRRGYALQGSGECSNASLLNLFAGADKDRFRRG